MSNPGKKTKTTKSAATTARKPRAKADKAVKPSKETKAAPASNSVPKPAKAKKASGLDAAAQVLKDAKQPMRCREIVQTMLDKGMWATSGKTPHATIYAAILREINTKGKDARFKKTDRGLFIYSG